MFGKDPKFKRMTVQYFEPNKQKISKKYFESLHIGSKKLLDFFLLYLYTMLTVTVKIWQWQKTNACKKFPQQILF